MRAQRKRVTCPAHLWSSSCPTKGVQATSPNDDVPAATPPKEDHRPKGPSSVPLKPVAPIQIPKDNANEEERLKQLESPETVELIKTFEIPEKVTEPVKEPTPEPPAKQPSPAVVAGNPQPEVVPDEEPKRAGPTDPSALFGPGPQQKLNKDIKEATSEFLSQEFSQPKKSSKRYTKSRQKNNHS